MADSKGTLTQSGPTQVLKVEVIEGRNLVAMDSTGTSDPYVIITAGGKEKRTKVIRCTLNPKWKIGSQSEKFSFKIPLTIKEVLIKCMDWDRFSADDRMGQVTIPFSDLAGGKAKVDWFTLIPQKTGDPVSGELKLSLQLIEGNSKPKENTPTAQNPLLKAVLASDVAKVEELLKDPKLDVNAPDERGLSILHIAASTPTQWNEGAVQTLLKLLSDPRTDVKLANQDKNTAFHYFCKKFTAPHVVGPFNRFIERGVDVNAQNVFGETPMHQAVFNPSLKQLMVDLLVKQHANINLGSASGETPLHYAVSLGRDDIVRFLIASGADIEAKSKSGKTPTDIAIEEKFEVLTEFLKDCKEILEWLKAQNLMQFREDFIQNDIFMFIIPELNDDILQKIIPDKEDRQKILEKAHQFSNDGEGTLEGKKKKEKLLKQLAMRKQESVLRANLRESARKRLASSNKAPSPPQPGGSSGGGPSPRSIASRKLTVKDFNRTDGNIGDSNWEIDARDLEFVQSLGAGSSGEVFSGLFEGQRVAIKVLKTNNTDNEVEEFKKEFQVLVALNSPYVIKFYGACLSGKLAMVMEFCSRGSLYDVLNKKDLDMTWDKFFDFALEVTAGVEVLHKHEPPILHRDLKTLNYLVTEDWHIKVCDFGLSRYQSGSNLATLSKCRGTYAYIAPEVYNCERFSTKSDMYSVAIIMWELCYRTIQGTYLRPFQEYKHLQFDFQILIQACKMKLRPTLPKTTPEPLVNLIKQSWHEQRDSRLEAWELKEKLTQLRDDYKKNPDAWNSALVRTK